MKTPFVLALLLGLAAPLLSQPDRHRLGAGDLFKFDALKRLPPHPQQGPRLILGDVHGFLHVYEEREEGYEEIWVSQYFEGGIREIFLVDVNDDGLLEIVFYTDRGRFHFLDIVDYTVIWSIPPNEYERITAMAIRDIDDDPQPELIFCGDGRLIIYDGRDQFESWRSEQDGFTSSEILIGDVDGDDTDEIVLNQGMVLDSRYFDIEWQSPEPFGESMGLLDVDDDGIPELIGEFRQRFLRVFDIDQRREKSPTR